jgi:hypothetical protein
LCWWWASDRECLRPVKRDREERACLSVSVSVLSLSVSVCLRVCVWVCVDAYDVLGSGAMADPCVAALAIVCADYENSSASDTPPTSGWTVVNSGQAPAPTITWL